MACEGTWPCCHCHCGECLCCDPYTSKTDCGICEGCIHTVRIRRPRICEHQMVQGAILDSPIGWICVKCGHFETAEVPPEVMVN